MEKIFHVFVSSTYSDLIDERKKVSEAVAKAGFVAEGMEIFPASSQNQMDFIGRVIDRCDYYILVLAGRYGSLAEDGLSYTEKEFRYAKEKGIPILAFIRHDIDSLPSDKLESDPSKREKLEALISSLKFETLVDFWSNPDELSTKALAALSQAKISHEGVGWIRADQAASKEILLDINDLRKQNERLSLELASINPKKRFDDLELAGLSETFSMTVTARRTGRTNKSMVVNATWGEILAAIGPGFRTFANTDGFYQSSFFGFIKGKLNLDSDHFVSLGLSTMQKILMQFEVLGLMIAQENKLAGGETAVLHKLTKAGLNEMLRENAVKSK